MSPELSAIPQRLTLVERATSRWIASSNPRHPVTLAIATSMMVLANVLGAVIDKRAYLVMAVWFVETWIAGSWAASHPDFRTRLRRYAIGVAIDVLFLGVVFFFMNAAQAIGVSFFTLMVVTASAVLPKRWAQGIAVLATAVFGALVAYDVFGPHDISSPLGLPPITGNHSYFLAVTAGAGVLIFLLLRTHEHVMLALHDSESRHDAVVRNSADVILIVDEQGRLVEVNPATLAATGYTWDEMKSLPNSAMFVAEDWPAVYDMFKRTLAGEAMEVEYRIQRKDGTHRWMEARTSRIEIEGRPAMVIAARDVTERRRAAEALRENDAALGLVLDALNSGFYTVDTHLIVTSVRGKGSGSGSALVGKSVVAIAPSAEEAVVQREQHKRALEGQVATWVWPVGGGHWVRSHVAPVRNAAGEITGAAGFWRDESAIMRARDEQDARWNRFRDSAAHRPPIEGE